MMFLAHFSGEGISGVLKMKLSEISKWYKEAFELHEELNTVSPDGK